MKMTAITDIFKKENILHYEITDMFDKDFNYSLNSGPVSDKVVLFYK